MVYIIEMVAESKECIEHSFGFEMIGGIVQPKSNCFEFFHFHKTRIENLVNSLPNKIRVVGGAVRKDIEDALFKFVVFFIK